MNTIKCPTCGQENKNINIRCELCGTELNHTESDDTLTVNNYYRPNVKTINLNGNIIKYVFITIMIFSLAPWFLGGTIIIGICAKEKIDTFNKSKNYLETEGRLVGYEDCRNSNNELEICKAIYEYVVNGHTYKGSPNLLTDRSSFKQIETIKYDPNNPSEYVMYSGANGMLIVGIIIFIVILVIFISTMVFIKKISNKVNSAKKDNQVINT